MFTATRSTVQGVENPDPYMTTEEAAAYLNRPRRFMSRAIEERRIKYTKDGKSQQSRVLFRKSWLDAYLAQLEEQAVEPEAK